MKHQIYIENTSCTKQNFKLKQPQRNKICQNVSCFKIDNEEQSQTYRIILFIFYRSS